MYRSRLRLMTDELERLQGKREALEEVEKSLESYVQKLHLEEMMLRNQLSFMNARMAGDENAVRESEEAIQHVDQEIEQIIQQQDQESRQEMTNDYAEVSFQQESQLAISQSTQLPPGILSVEGEGEYDDDWVKPKLARGEEDESRDDMISFFTAEKPKELFLNPHLPNLDDIDFDEEDDDA